MKTLLLTFMICLFNLNTTEIIGKYQIESQRSFDTLELKKDGTYEYLSRGDSCWMWLDISGTWKLKSDQLTLYHKYSFQEETTEYIEESDKVSKDKVSFLVTNFDGVPIPEFEVNYSSEDDKTQTRKTDINGAIIFDKYDIVYNENDNVGIQIKYKINGNDTSESTSINRNSDRIILKINSKPKTIHKKEEYLFSFKNGILKSVDFRYVDEISTYNKL
jgi:hypothetical protein